MTNLGDIKDHLKKINDSPIYDTATMLVDGVEFDKLVDTFNALEAELTLKLTHPQSEIIHHEQIIRKLVKEILGE